jgi:23S rRNA (pseudouridine1915-N3)-methyltransferase
MKSLVMPLVLVDGSSQTVFEDQQGQEYLPPKLHEGCQTFPSIGLFWKCLKIQYLVTETQTTALGLDMANWRKSADYPKNRYFYNFSEPSVTNLRSTSAWDQATRGWFILLAMRVTLIQISPHVASKDGFEALTAVYVQRCSAFARFDTRLFRTGQAMLDWLDRRQGRTAAVTVLCDPRGRQMSSEAFAKWLGIRRDQGAQHIAFAVGPPDGWSNAARERAGLLLSLGPLTLPHPLARLVLAEQVYRAFTILAGHPYHSGH